MSELTSSTGRHFGVRHSKVNFIAAFQRFLVRSIASVAVLASLFCTPAVEARIGSQYQLLAGNPSNATTTTSNSTNYLITRDQYALSYNDSTRQPNWVSWNFTTDDRGGAQRSNDFFQDTSLPTGYYQVKTTDYSGSGYDRGHMSPSADRTLSREDNDATFLMSNMIPQTPDNNQGVWANFENYTRSLGEAGNEILIISGPGGFGGSSLASGVGIAGYTWKIVLVVPLGPGSAIDRITAATRVIALKIPNTAGVRSTPWQNFVTSISQLETETGYTFLSSLPASIANALRPVVDGQTAVGSPAITGQPVSQTTVVGGSATFAVTATGDAPLTYQWLHNEDEIAGATSATLTLNNVQAADLGSYVAVVSNAIGTTTSNAASLIITGLRPVISTSPASQAVAAGSTLTLTVEAIGSPTLAYQWRKNGIPISGNASAATAALTLVNVQSGDAASYDVVVANSVGSATSATAALAVNPAVPSIATQPLPRTANTGGNASFTVLATGTAPLSYQWRKNGGDLSDGGVISGATAATLVLTGVTSLDDGSYDVVVTNALGFVLSASATLAVSPPPPATVFWNFGATATPTAEPTSGLNDDLTGGTLTQGNNNGTTALLTTTSASSPASTFSGANNAGAAARIGPLVTTPGGSAYFEFTLAPSAGKRLLASGLSFGSRSTGTGPQAYAVFTSLDGFAAPVASGALNNNSSWAMQTPAFPNLTGGTGEAVTFRIYGYNGAGNAGASTANWRIDDLKLTVTTVFPPPVPPEVIDVSPANGASSVAVGDPIVITFNEAVSFTGTWFSIISSAHGPLAATVTGGPTAFSLRTPSLFANNDTITVTVFGAQVVDQASGVFHGLSDTTFTFTTESYVPPTPPGIITPPASQTVNVGDNVAFSVEVAGSPILTYQWRKDGVAISGNATANTAVLTLTGVAMADAGSYSCLVSNAAGSDLSAAATLTVVTVPPTITTQPAAQLVALGTDATFTVAASGTAPFSYQWRKDGLAINDNASATTATLTVSSVTAASSGSYDVVVSNQAGSTTSGAAILAVTSTPPAAIYWDFATASPTSGVPVGITGGTVTQGNNNGTTALLTTTSASNAYAGASGGNNAGAAARIGSLNQGTGGSAYFEFTFTPDAGRQLVASALSVGVRSTGTGPQAIAVYTSANGFAAPIATSTVANNSAWTMHTPAFAGVTGGVGEAVTFRIYGYAGTGSPGASTANWRIDDLRLTAGLLVLPAVAPSVLQQPQSVTATVGDGANFSIEVAGTAPFTYQWRKDGEALLDNASATTAMLSLTGITTLDAGNYDCVVTNLAGAVTSEVAPLTVEKAAATVTLGDLSAVYDGLPKSVLVATDPAGLSVTVTYDGSLAAPAAAGSYAVVATVTDSNYEGAATGTLVITGASGSITLGDLKQAYDGTPKSVTVTTNPANLAVDVTYDGSPVAPIYPGSYAVVATFVDSNYTGSAIGTLVISPTVLVRHAPTFNADVDGSIQVLLPEAITLNGNASVAGDLLVPGSPTVRRNGNPLIGGIVEGPGNAAPSNYIVTLNGNAMLGRLVRRIDAATMPTVSAPPAPAGTRNVSLNSVGQTPGDFSTLRNLTLNGNYGPIAIPAGTYGSFTANGNGSFVLGVAGSTEPAIYNLQSLTLNGSSSLKIVGPVILTLANGTAVNGNVGATSPAEWLTLKIASGGLTLNGNVTVHAQVIAPNGTVVINGNSLLRGRVVADRLTLNGNALLTGEEL